MPFKKQMDTLTYLKWNFERFPLILSDFFSLMYYIFITTNYYFFIATKDGNKRIDRESAIEYTSHMSRTLDYREFASRILRRADRSRKFRAHAKGWKIHGLWWDLQGAPFLRWAIAFLFLFFPPFFLQCSPFFLPPTIFDDGSYS